HAGGWKNATNNRGELMAVLDLLRSTADSGEDLKVFCDSQYVINALTKWMPGWKRRGWKKADGKDVLNKDLLELLDVALRGREVEFEWVKGHSYHAMNEAADERARAAATAFQKGTSVPEGPGYVPAGAAESVTELTGASAVVDGSEQATTVISCRVTPAVPSDDVARAPARGNHPQEFLAELIGRSLENE